MRSYPEHSTQEKCHIAKCMNDLWPKADSEEDTGDRRRQSSCWLTRESAELDVIFLRPLTLLNYLMCHRSKSLPLSFSVSPSFTGQAAAQEWLSVAKPDSKQAKSPISGLGWATIDFLEDTSLSFWSKHTRHQHRSTIGYHATFAE